MPVKLECMVPKQIVAIVAKAKGWVGRDEYWVNTDGKGLYKHNYDPFNDSSQALQLVSEFGLSINTTHIKTMPPTTQVVVSKGIDNKYMVSVQERNVEDMTDYHSELERMIRQAVVMVVAKIALAEPVAIEDQIMSVIQEKIEDGHHRELINIVLNRRTFLDLLNDPETFKLFDGPYSYSTEEPYFLMGYELEIVEDGPNFEVTIDQP